MKEPELIDAESMEKIIPKERAFDFWIVVAWWHGGWWKSFPQLYDKRFFAVEKAESLPTGYTFRYVFRIRNTRES